MYLYDNNTSKGIYANLIVQYSCTDFNYKNGNISKCRERIVQQPSDSPSNITILGNSKWYNFYHHYYNFEQCSKEKLNMHIHLSSNSVLVQDKM